MAKTVFSAGDKSLGIKGTKVTAAFLNAINAHVHDGADADGSAEKIALAHLADAVAALLVPTGTVIHVAQADAPTGWLKADGSAVSRATYAALFALIGTTYGAGNGGTTFNLPDLRGEFIRGLDSGRGVDAGRTLGSAQADALKAHHHEQTSGGTLNGGAGFVGVGGNTPSGINTQDTGDTETRPRNIALLACIKY